MTYKEAKKLAIKEVKTKSNGDYVYVVVNIGKRQFDIAHDWMEFMYERMFGYFCENQNEGNNQR